MKLPIIAAFALGLWLGYTMIDRLIAIGTIYAQLSVCMPLMQQGEK